MATKVYFDGIWEYDDERIFRVIGSRDSLWVKSFTDGIAVVDPCAGSEIRWFAAVVAGCFEEGSNFEEELGRAFETGEESPILTGIQFEFNGVTVLVTSENANVDKIYEEWNAGMEANAEEYRRKQEAYMKTDEYRMKRAKELKAAYRRSIVEQDVIAVDETTEVEFASDEDKAKWDHSVEINSHDGYSLGVVTYARRWVKYMQHLMAKHNKPLEVIAGPASHVADIDGITGFMYGCAVAMIAESWIHGEELRRWHNNKYGVSSDADGVVNPAVLTIG